jgi:hypothetical protein
VRKASAVALFLVACGGRAAAPPAQEARQDTAGGGATVDTTFPAPRRGGLVARPIDPVGPAWEWEARAARCVDPKTLQLLARGDTVDLLIVLWLPADSAPEGSYAVLGPQDSTVAPRTARVGAQRWLYADLAYRALRGTVWLERLDRQATGRFDVVFEESISHEPMRYLGAFNTVPVDSAADAACRPAQRAGRDSAGAARAPRRMLD